MDTPRASFEECEGSPFSCGSTAWLSLHWNLVHGITSHLGIESVEANHFSDTVLQRSCEAPSDPHPSNVKYWLLRSILEYLRDMSTNDSPTLDEVAWKVADLEAFDRLWKKETTKSITGAAYGDLQTKSGFDDQCLDIFRKVYLQACPAFQIARDTQLSLTEIYLCQHKCMQYMRNRIREINKWVITKS